MKKNVLSLALLTTILVMSMAVSLAKADPANIGEWTSDGRIELCVHSFNTSSFLSFYPYEPETTGYIFAWVDLSLKNVGTEEVSTNFLYAYLKDTDNYFYKYVYTQTPKNWQLIDLPPGETLRGEIYFEVPSEAIIDEFIWHDYGSYISIIIPEFTPFALIIGLITVSALVVVLSKRKAKA